MIAFSCVHCGLKMAITEDGGGKKAQCQGCGQTVVVPANEPGLRRSGRQRRAEPPPAPTRVLEPPTLSKVAAPGPTRAEPAPPGPLTSFLAPPQAADEIGRLGPYRVLEVVGAGGMGVVFKALDPGLARVVALKALLPALAVSPTARERFLREARAAAALQHDHVVTIFQVGEDRGVPWLAMPFLRGEALDARLRRQGGALPLPEARRIAGEIALGLEAIHEQGLIHRDIKPANVWLEAPAGRVKILDFGLARAAAGEVQLTQEGTIVGSPAFMAPEQASRQPVDARADLFSLGCVLYLMVTGVLAFDGGDALATLLAVTTRDPPPPHGVPAEVSRLVMRLLAKRPDDRPASAREVIEELSREPLRATGRDL